MRTKVITALAVVAAFGAVPAAASATSCPLYGVPITNVHTNVGCGTADTIAQVEYYKLMHWVSPHPGPAWRVTWRTVRGRYVSSLAFTARYGKYWATFEVGP